jgi:hypothetical protein
MKKINIIVNIISFLVALMSFLSAIIVWQVLPSGQGFRGGKGELENIFFLGLARHHWMDIHIISSLIFIILIIIHLILHWHWIKSLPRMVKE